MTHMAPSSIVPTIFTLRSLGKWIGCMVLHAVAAFVAQSSNGPAVAQMHRTGQRMVQDGVQKRGGPLHKKIPARFSGRVA